MGLVSCKRLAEHPEWLVVDCRHDLKDPEHGPAVYERGHIPGAVHAHLDRDLSSSVGDGSDGRHPLPRPESFVAFLQASGLTDQTVVCYDDVGGAWAGRAWWLLRHYGHKDVHLLDGGWRRWQELGLPVATEPSTPTPGTFAGTPGHMPTLDAMAVQMNLDTKRYQLADARAPERFRGDVEPLDPVAGHIPGAINLPFTDNLASDGRFLSPDDLRERYEVALGVQDASRVAVYCGSGVTAAHDVFAMHVAGMGTPALYPGSWSEWCQPDAERPCVTPKA